jgi:uncharacterized protein YndB with AHSA1/START domain
MAHVIVTPDLDTIVSEIEIAAPPERVFKAITDPVDVRKRAPELDAYEMDLRVGGKWFLEMDCQKHPFRGVTRIRHEGEILELDPPRLIVYTWLANFHDDPQRRTIVRWDLTPTATGTNVKVTHSGLASEPESSKAYAGGWPGVLAEIQQYVER